MGKPTGFKEFPRKTVPYRAPLARLEDFLEIYTDADEEHLRTQGRGAWIAACLSACRMRAVRSTI